MKICRIVAGISINALDSDFIYFSVLFITSYNSLVTEGDVDLWFKPKKWKKNEEIIKHTDESFI